MYDLKTLAKLTGGTLVLADTRVLAGNTSHEDIAEELKKSLSDFFKAQVQHTPKFSEITGSSDRIKITINVMATSHITVVAKSQPLPGKNELSMKLRFTSLSKSEFNDLTDALIRFHELVSASISIGTLG